MLKSEGTEALCVTNCIESTFTWQFVCSSKRPKLDQVPAASLDADDPLDEENSDDPDSDDDTAQLLAELQRIKKERAMDQAKRVSRHGADKILCHLR
jgi:hypothetical protein